MRLNNRKIAILIESDFFENEIFYYQLRFAEEGADVHFLSRLWGNPSITYTDDSDTAAAPAQCIPVRPATRHATPIDAATTTPAARQPSRRTPRSPAIAIEAA